MMRATRETLPVVTSVTRFQSCGGATGLQGLEGVPT